MAAEWNEPAVTINGTPLTEAQAMTIRVALGAFAMNLESNGLGDDYHGAAMTTGYLAAIRHIVALMENT
jgi:hypothetical protein